ncbi:MAG: hypothetical protein AB7U63_12175 [Porticoccaceae bacterium]
MNVLQAMQTPELFGDTFTGDSWEAWRAVLSGAFALPMDDNRLALFKQLSGGREPPSERVRELWCVAGRRSAKSHTAAAVAVYMATIGAELMGLTNRLSPGERGTVALLATDRSQAKTLLHYIRGILEGSPLLSGMVVKSNTESIELNNRTVIEISTANYKAIRSRSCLAVLMDEMAFFRSEDTSEASDKEIYRAAVPALATTDGLLIGISSPYAKRGLLYEKYQKHYGEDSPRVLVVKGSTPDFNPTINPEIIAAAVQDDPEAAKTEWLAAFRDGVASFIEREIVESCTRPRPLQIPPRPDLQYTAFVDPAGGGESNRSDEFTMSIGYRDEAKRVIVCGVWGRKGSPAEITAEYAQILKAYNCTTAYSDRYAGAYPVEAFASHNITLRYTDRNRSQLYGELLPMLNTGQIELPPDDRLTGQLASLERKPGRLQDIIDHAPGSHDDRSNAVAGLAYHAGVANRAPIHINVTFAV